MIFDDDTLEQLGHVSRWEDTCQGVLDEYNLALARKRTGFDRTNRIARIKAKLRCASCGNEMIANRPRRKKHCSDKCRAASIRAQRVQTIVCICCKASVTAKRAGQRFCGALCQQRTYDRTAVRLKYKTNPEFRRRRIEATIRCQQKRKAA